MVTGLGQVAEYHVMLEAIGDHANAFSETVFRTTEGGLSSGEVQLLGFQDMESFQKELVVKGLLLPRHTDSTTVVSAPTTTFPISTLPISQVNQSLFENSGVLDISVSAETSTMSATEIPPAVGPSINHELNGKKESINNYSQPFPAVDNSFETVHSNSVDVEPGFSNLDIVFASRPNKGGSNTC